MHANTTPNATSAAGAASQARRIAGQDTGRDEEDHASPVCNSTAR
jgi:hypothetical protein